MSAGTLLGVGGANLKIAFGLSAAWDPIWTKNRSKGVNFVTPKQDSYIQHRAAGMLQARAAAAAGYSEKTTKVIASRLESKPEIKEAIELARQSASANRTANTEDQPEFENAEQYLVAVVQGTTPPDPLRITAAKTLIAYQKGRQRAPIKSATPGQMNAASALAEDVDMLDQWAEKAAAVRARLANK